MDNISFVSIYLAFGRNTDEGHIIPYVTAGKQDGNEVHEWYFSLNSKGDEQYISHLSHLVIRKFYD